MPPIECAPLRQKPQATRTPQATLARQAILICLLIAALGAWWGQDEDFTIIVIPDTQFYSAGMNGGSPEIFEAQTRWIAENRSALNIVFVTHLGDYVQNGDEILAEWEAADAAISLLEVSRQGGVRGPPA